MKRLTLDASVVCKWFLADADDEPHMTEAQAVLDGVGAGAVTLVQPIHWRLEVLAVLARRRPAFANDAGKSLARLNSMVIDDARIDAIALQLTHETGAHLFDTLYHAVALATPDGVLVTADLRYLAKASRFGQVIPLSAFVAGVEEPKLDYHVVSQRTLRRMSASS